MQTVRVGHMAKNVPTLLSELMASSSAFSLADSFSLSICLSLSVCVSLSLFIGLTFGSLSAKKNAKQKGEINAAKNATAK